jgi:hypothetical protein
MQKTDLKKVNKLLTYIVLLDSLIVVYIHDYADRIIEVLSQDLKCLCNKSTTVLSERSIPKSMDEPLMLLLHYK